MSLQNMSKKALAVVLSVTMLMSCMVFSFSASAAEELLWENDFSDTTAPWYTHLEDESGKGNYNSGMVGRTDGDYGDNGNYAVYHADGSMKLGFASWSSRKYLSGFTVRHKTATVKNASGYGSGGVAKYDHNMGAFSPAAGKYKIEFDYRLKDLVEDASTVLNICVGFANAENFFWDNNRSLDYFTQSSRGGTYQVAASVRLSDLGMDWAHATVYEEITGSADRSMHIFLSSEYHEPESNPEGSVLIDNIKVSAIDEIPAPGGGEDPGSGGEPDPSPGGEPQPDDGVRWENDFSDITAPWYGVLESQSGRGSFNTGTVGLAGAYEGVDRGGNYAVYDNGAMKLGFASWESRTLMSGFTVRHKTATVKGAVGTYGSGGAAEWRTEDGAFSPTAGKYKIEFDYKLNDLVDDASTVLNICVGFANAEAFFWDKDRGLEYFANSACQGTYQVAASVRLSDLAAGWAHATVYEEITGNEDRSMYVFVVNELHDPESSPEGSVLVDNIKVTEIDEIPAPGGGEPDPGPGGEPDPGPQPPQYEGPVLIWENHFDNGNSTNWASAYGGKEDGSYWNSGKAHTDVKNYSVIRQDGGNTFMSLGFGNEAARSKVSGFVFLHQEATHNLAGQYGYAGGLRDYKISPNAGEMKISPGYYIISFDYKLNSLTNASGAAFDFAVSTCGDLLLDSEAGVDEMRMRANKGDPKRLVHVTASDRGKDWQHITINYNNLAADSLFLYFYIVAADGYAGSLAGSELWIDNIEIRMDMDESKFTDITFYYEGQRVGQSAGALPGMYFAMPTLNLPEVPAGHKIVYYSDPECKNLITAPVAYPQQSMNIYLRIVQDTGNTWGFETEANDTRLSLETIATEATIDVDNTVAHSGGAAARIHSGGGQGSPNLYAQMMLQNGFNKPISVAIGRTYVISFHLYVPEGQTPYDIRYWLAATESDKLFDKDYNASYSAKNYLVAEGVAAMPNAGEWVKVEITVEDCQLEGKLRIGLDGDSDASHPFYIDDILVVSVPADPNTWSFETEPNDTLLSINARVPETTIYTDNTSAVFSGISAARVTSDGGHGCPNLWPQMFVKNGADEQVYVYKSRSYEVRLRLFVPTGQPSYDVNFWLAASEEDTEFNKDYEHEYSVKYYGVAEAVYTPEEQGDWLEVVIPIDNCPRTGKLRIGFNGNRLVTNPFYIDDILVQEVTKEPDMRVESYERYDLGKKLSLNTDGASITVSDEDSLSGDYSAKIVTRGNNVYAAPQMAVTDMATKPVKVEKGKSYHISFWVCVPISQPDYDIQYWMAVTDSTAAFTSQITNAVVKPQTVEIKNKHAWQIFRADIINCAYTGTLRLGITGSTNTAHTFYLDDIYVREIQPADPNAMNFEMYEPGTTLHINEDDNTFTVSDTESYTGGQSVYVHADNNHENRPQMQVLDAKGNQVKVKKGDNFYVTFMVLIPETEPYFNFSYYVAAVPDAEVNRAFRYRSSFVSANYKLGGQEWVTPPPAGEWTQIKIAVLDCPYEGNLRIGLCHGNGHPFQSNFYVDDIKVYEPEYVLVKFDTNGSEDKIDDMLLLSDMLIPYDGVDPYREGYEFMGWYTSKNFDKDSFFDVYTMPIVGKTGDVITLYACWRKWDDVTTGSKQDETDLYEIEYYTEKVWVGDQNVPELPYTRGEFAFADPAPVDKTPADTNQKDALPPWLMVLIIVGAVVVVGGGSTLAAILLKKKKNV